MGVIKNLYNRAVLVPLAEYLKSEAQADTQKSSNPGGAMVRDALSYGAYGSYRSKPNSGGVSFQTLRKFSKQYDVARAAINRRKRQLNQLQWDIVSADPTVKVNENQAREVKQIFKGIGGYKVRFREFIDTMVEDLLVLDAVSIYKRPTMGGKLYNLQVVDAATIKLKVDASGGTPEPPEIAYVQVIRGKEEASFTADEMYYEMLNPRTESPYGLSPLESMILTISTALKSQTANLTMLSEGNIPEGYFGVPDTWSPDKIKEFQEVWDSAIEGNPSAQSKIKFGPQGTYERFIKPEDMRFKELQEWLMKTTCMMFEIPPQELGFTETVNRATGEVQQDIGRSSGLIPLANFFEEIFTDVIQVDLGHPDLMFKFKGLENTNEKQKAEVSEIRIRSGYSTVDQERAIDGLDPLGIDEPFVIGTPTFLKGASEAPVAGSTTDQNSADQAGVNDSETQKSAEDVHIQLVTELRAFRKYALKRSIVGKNLLKFNSEVLPKTVVDEINTRLSKADNPEAVKAIFKEFMQDYQVDFLANVVELKKDLAKVI